MSQIEENKAKLFEMMERLAHEPLTLENIRNLNTLRGAYKALCLVSGEEHHEHNEEHEEHVKEHPKAPATA